MDCEEICVIELEDLVLAGEYNPCNGTGVIDLLTLVDLTECESMVPTFNVLVSSPDDLLVSISGTGLVWQFSNAEPHERYSFIVQMRCNCKKGTFRVTVCTSDPCATIDCPGSVCDPCTGACAPIESDLCVTAEIL